MKSQQNHTRGIFYSYLLFLIIISAACQSDKNPVEPDKGDYQLVAKYDSIRSYPLGGGIFVIKMIADNDFSGTVQLRLESEPKLTAKLPSELNKADSVFEVTISPTASLSPGVYEIKLFAMHAGIEKSVLLKVHVYDWGENIENANIKLNEFREWIETNEPRYSEIFSNPLDIYLTYPQTLIVEHYTYLTNKFEVRLCYHVMIPPHDWSMICIRDRKHLYAEASYKLESDGQIHAIEIKDYPVLYGY